MHIYIYIYIYVCVFLCVRVCVIKPYDTNNHYATKSNTTEKRLQLSHPWLCWFRTWSPRNAQQNFLGRHQELSENVTSTWPAGHVQVNVM